MSNKITVWVVLLSMLTLTACHKNRISKSNKGIVSDTVAVMADSSRRDSILVSEAVEPIKVNEVSFEYLTAKSKFSIESQKQNFDNTNVNIRMKKDSLIWISVTGIGFEVARGLITPDSIVFMDKFHKQYFIFTYEQLSRKYDFELNFPLLQSIIVGNLPFPQKLSDTFTKADNFFLLSQDTGRLGISNYIAADNLKLSRLKAVETGKDNSFTLQYSDFRTISDVLFPFTSLVTLNVKLPQGQPNSETVITLKHSRVDLVSQSPGFPFTIPSGYTRNM
jgi:hypothetical protein